MNHDDFLKYLKGVHQRLEREVAGPNADSLKNTFESKKIYNILLETQAGEVVHNEPILAISSLVMQFGNF